MDKTILTLVVVAAFVASTVATVAIVSAQGDTIIACVNNKSQGKDLRIVDSADDCRNNETPLEWNKQGPPGADGEDGTPGATGMTGMTGLAGADGADGEDGTPGATGMTGMTGMDGEDADPQDIIDLQNRVSFLESLHNQPPIVDLGPDQAHQGIRISFLTICEGSRAFTIPAPGVTDDGLLSPLVVKWRLNSQTGNTWFINGNSASPGNVFTAPITSVISWNGGQDVHQRSSWTVTAFDGQFTGVDTINLDCFR